MPAVSVILPTCDRPILLERAIRSVLAQTWTDLELLLVDSNRRTPPVRQQPGLRQLLADSRVKLIDRCNPDGSSAARNLALERAEGEWISYLDDDDYYRPDKLAVQLGLARRTAAPIVSCGFEVLLPFRRCIRQSRKEWFVDDELLLEGIWRPPALLHRRDSLRFSGGHAGDDMYYAHAFFARHDLRRVPNAPHPLVVVDQRHAGHVFADRESAWNNFRRTLRDFGPRYTWPARRLYLLRGMIFRAQGGQGSWLALLRMLAAACRQNPGSSWRLVLNSLAYRSRWLRPFVVRA